MGEPTAPAAGGGAPEHGPEIFPDDALSEDAFLDGALKILQPRDGYRAAADAVMLAAACPAQRGDRVLDVGCGAGVAAFCLHARAPGVSLEGVEIQAAYAALSRRNAQRNHIPWIAHAADIRTPPLALRATAYDHVLTNPPFYAPEAALALKDPVKDAAYRESAPIETWIDFCLRRLAPRGGLTMIHRAERVPEILAALAGRAGDVELIPLWPRVGEAAKRIVLRAWKEARGPFQLRPGLVLHRPNDGGYTERATAILRDGAPLDI